MLFRRFFLCCLILSACMAMGCRDRWRSSYRNRQPLGAYGNGACVNDDYLYDVPPERMLRKENRELLQWYREIESSRPNRRVTRMRQRGRLPRGYAQQFGYEDQYYADGCGDCGGCEDCCSCMANPYGHMGPDVSLGYSQPFNMQMGQMGESWSEAGESMPPMMPNYNPMSSQACPVCGHHGPAYQIPPDQMVPHSPGANPEAAEPAAPEQESPGTEAEPSPAAPPSATVQPMYFAPPRR